MYPPPRFNACRDHCADRRLGHRVLPWPSPGSVCLGEPLPKTILFLNFLRMLSLLFPRVRTTKKHNRYNCSSVWFRCPCTQKWLGSRPKFKSHTFWINCLCFLATGRLRLYHNVYFFSVHISRIRRRPVFYTCLQNTAALNKSRKKRSPFNVCHVLVCLHICEKWVPDGGWQTYLTAFGQDVLMIW